MTAAAWIAIVALMGCIALIFALTWALDRAARAERHLRWLHHQAQELRADYGAEIQRSKRMASRLIERED